ncbi:MAG: PilW family protein [Burkholderiales bacterium]|nr:PilW family protein [Burkholderiales bacterium]MDE2610092.1 PilW family protein [Burkholderiales bacterium]
MMRALEHQRWRGASLIELMIALSLGSLLLLAATAMLLASQRAYVYQMELAALHERGAFALTILRRVVRMAGYRDWDLDAGRVVWPPPRERVPAIRGKDNCALAVAACGPSVNGSDLLEVRHEGSGAGEGDGSVLDCAGRRVPGPRAGGSASFDERGRSVFYVARSSSGEPALYCRYFRWPDGSRAEALVEGVENFQVIYGIDANGDGVPERFLPARQLQAAQWHQVVAVQLALVLRSPIALGSAEPPAVFYLFGRRYPETDGTYRPAADVPRARHGVSATIQLRNAMRGPS